MATPGRGDRQTKPQTQEERLCPRNPRRRARPSCAPPSCWAPPCWRPSAAATPSPPTPRRQVVSPPAGIAVTARCSSASRPCACSTPAAPPAARSACPPPRSSAPGESIDVAVAGVGAVPTDATSVAVNITIDEDATLKSFLTVWPAGQTRPNTSANNAEPGLVSANSAIFQLGTDGKLSVFNQHGHGQRDHGRDRLLRGLRRPRSTTRRRRDDDARRDDDHDRRRDDGTGLHGPGRPRPRAGADPDGRDADWTQASPSRARLDGLSAITVTAIGTDGGSATVTPSPTADLGQRALAATTGDDLLVAQGPDGACRAEATFTVRHR